MCEADAFIYNDGHEELIMKSVDTIEPEKNDAWVLVDIFGDQKTVKGRIRKMNLVDHRIIFESSDA